MNVRDLTLFFSLVLFVSIAFSQPSLPHRVYGEVTSESDGSAMADLNVTFKNSSSYIVATQNTDSTGYYDLNLNNLQNKESAYLFLDGSNTSEYVNFSRGDSTALDCIFDGGSCVEESGSGDGTDDNDNNNGGNTDPSGGGSGGSGTSGGSGGGGFAPVPDDDSVEVSSELDNNGQTNVSVGDVEEDQFVEVKISGAEYLDGFSFTADSAGSVSVYIESSESRDLEKESSEIFHYFEVNVQGINSFRNASLGYTLPNSVLNERNASAKDVAVHLHQNESWESLGNTVTYEGISSNSFRADSGTSDGVFGLEISSKDEQDGDNTQPGSQPELQVQSLTVTPSEDSQTATVNIVAVNNEEETVSDTIELRRNGEIIKEWDITLESGETKELSYSSDIAGSESYRFSAGSKTTSIGSQEPGEDEGGLPIFLILVGGVVLLAIIALLAYIYITEYRRASELDEVIEGIERKGNQVNNEMGEMRENIENLRNNVRSSRNKEDNN